MGNSSNSLSLNLLLKKLPQGALSWAFYDWANSAFALIVLAGIFPIFYPDFWAKGMSAADQTFWYGLTVTTASLAVAIMAPFLGAIADRGGRRKIFLLSFAIMGALATALIVLPKEGQWKWASLAFIFGAVGFYCANIFYDSLLVDVSDRKNAHLISGLGFSLGYFGSVLLFIFNIIIIERAADLGPEKQIQATRFAFLCTAVWWMLFTIPLMLYVKEPKSGRQQPFGHVVGASLHQLRKTIGEISKNRTVFWFLIAYWFYIDGVNTIVTMAVNYGKILGFETGSLLKTLILVQVVGVPFALLFGWLGQRLGPTKLLHTGILIYLGVTVYGSMLTLEPTRIFGHEISKIYILGFLIGSVQGGLQALSRSYFVTLIPRERAAEYFGFYNMIGKSAAILGPLIMGTIAKLSGEPRYGILAVSLLFVAGGICLLQVGKRPINCPQEPGAGLAE